MPITIKSVGMSYKDPTTGNFVGVNAVGDAAYDAIAPDYSELTFPVSAGQHCIHEGNYYVSNQEIATLESWTAAHWTQLTVGEEVAGLKASVQSLPTDVQVNGTSVLSQGVANVPVATYSQFGVAKFDSGFFFINSQNTVKINRANDSQIKGGTADDKPLTPSFQHYSTFYGLAKASGDTTQSSSANAIGVYTPEAKAAIWNMLGLDGSAFVKSDWELIKEATGTNSSEADIEVAVDGNGNAFELTDAIVKFELPSNADSASKGLYGNVNFYYGSSSAVIVQGGVMTRNAGGSSMGAFYRVEQRDGLCFADRSSPQSTTNSGYLAWRYHATTNQSNGIFRPGTYPLIFTKITIPAVTGEWHYTIFGKRKRAALDSPVINVTGTTPSITALAGHRYICGEVSTLSIVAPASGCIDVTFESGSTATVLTVTSAKTGVSAVKWANGFDPTSLNANTTYEINIMDGEYGVSCTWT